MLEGMRRNGEVVKTEERCEVSGIASLVSKNVLLMQKDGAGEWAEVGRVVLA